MNERHPGVPWQEEGRAISFSFALPDTTTVIEASGKSPISTALTFPLRWPQSRVESRVFVLRIAQLPAQSFLVSIFEVFQWIGFWLDK